MKDAMTHPAARNAAADRARETRERVQALRTAIARFDEIDLRGILMELHDLRHFIRRI